MRLQASFFLTIETEDGDSFPSAMSPGMCHEVSEQVTKALTNVAADMLYQGAVVEFGPVSVETSK